MENKVKRGVKEDVIITRDISMKRVYEPMREVFFDFYCWSPEFKKHIDSGEELEIKREGNNYIWTGDSNIKIPCERHKFDIMITELSITIKVPDSIWCSSLMLRNINDYLNNIYGIYVNNKGTELGIMEPFGVEENLGVFRRSTFDKTWTRGLKLSETAKKCLLEIDDKLDVEKDVQVLKRIDRHFSEESALLYLPMVFRIHMIESNNTEVPAITGYCYNSIIRYIYGGGKQVIDTLIEKLITELEGLRLYPVGEVVWSWRGTHSKGRVKLLDNSETEYRLVID